MSGQSVITANKRYFRGFMITIIIYAVIVFAGPLAIGFIDNPQKWMFALLAVLSAAPAAYIFVLIGRFLKETDEYTRQRLASAMVIAGGVTFSFCFLWGFLELYRGRPSLLDVPDAPVVLRQPVADPAIQKDHRLLKNTIRELRSERGWSQARLAELLDVSRQSINAIETGKYDPSLPLAFKIARLFERSIEEIFEEDSLGL